MRCVGRSVLAFGLAIEDDWASAASEPAAAATDPAAPADTASALAPEPAAVRTPLRRRAEVWLAARRAVRLRRLAVDGMSPAAPRPALAIESTPLPAR